MKTAEYIWMRLDDLWSSKQQVLGANALKGGLQHEALCCQASLILGWDRSQTFSLSVNALNVTHKKWLIIKKNASEKVCCKKCGGDTAQQEINLT